MHCWLLQASLHHSDCHSWHELLTLSVMRLDSHKTHGAVYAQAMEAKLGLEARRVRELEGLIARLRASQFRSQTDGQMAGSRTDALTRRNQQLEEEVAALILLAAIALPSCRDRAHDVSTLSIGIASGISHLWHGGLLRALALLNHGERAV